MQAATHIFRSPLPIDEVERRIAALPDKPATHALALFLPTVQQVYGRVSQQQVQLYTVSNIRLRATYPFVGELRALDHGTLLSGHIVSSSPETIGFLIFGLLAAVGAILGLIGVIMQAEGAWPLLAASLFAGGIMFGGNRLVQSTLTGC